MARAFDVNYSKAAQARTGAMFCRLKNNLVATGLWTVVGSGDGTTRYAYEGVTGALPLAQQGAGGAYDCLLTGSGVSGGGACDWDASGWVVLRDGAGREVLLVDSSGATANYNSYGRIAVSPAAGFDGSVAGFDTIPGAAVDEMFMIGTRVSSLGNIIFLYNGAAYVHFWWHDALVNTVAGFGWVVTDAAGGFQRTIMGTCGVGCDTAVDPMVWWVPNQWNGFNRGDADHPGTWNTSLSIETYLQNSMAVDPDSGDSQLVPLYLHGSLSDISGGDFGYMLDCVQQGTAGQVFPAVFDDGTNAWAGETAVRAAPWPSAATIPASGAGTVFSADLLWPPDTAQETDLFESRSSAVTYLQRVWDTVNLVWCYYSGTSVDPTPASGDTVPAHSGSITAHNVVAVT